MKIRTTVGREMTINTGNYSNVKPSISLSAVHDEDITEEVYQGLSKILDSLLALETLALAGEIEAVNENGWGFYVDTLKNSLSDIKVNFEEGIEELVKVARYRE